MKKLKNIPAMLVLLLCCMSLSCSSPAYVQKDESVNLNNYSTYMWVDSRSNESDQAQKATAYVDISMRNAVNAELSKWGWRETTSDPDVLVSYDVLVERTTETNREAVYSQPFTRMFYNPYTRRWSTIYYPSQFQGYEVYQVPVREGTVTVTLIEARSDRNIWQGWTTRRLDNTRITDDEINSSVRDIFNKAS